METNNKPSKGNIILKVLWVFIIILFFALLFAIHPILGVLGVLVPIALIWSGLKN